MREIKFRAWDDKNKKMHQNISPWRWDFVISNSWHRCEKSNGEGILGSGGNEAEMLVPAVRYDEIMQFTGLKDKNGKEIYENDILRDKDGDLYTVENWGDSVFRIVYNTITWEWLFQAYAKGLLRDELEVIGKYL